MIGQQTVQISIGHQLARITPAKRVKALLDEEGPR